jgi:hypothetical protein
VNKEPTTRQKADFIGLAAGMVTAAAMARDATGGNDMTAAEYCDRMVELTKSAPRPGTGSLDEPWSYAEIRAYLRQVVRWCLDHLGED